MKARIWREEFGRNQAVPVALLSGVFGVGALRAAYGVAVRGFVTWLELRAVAELPRSRRKR